MLTFSEFVTFVEEVTSETSSKLINDFDNGIFNSSLKNDGSIVTDTDICAEKFIRNKISQNFKDHDIIGEELTDKILENECKWIIDPIDGTFSFTTGVPLFGTLIGFLYENTPTFGCLRLPKIQNHLIIGDNNKCLLNNNPLLTTPFKGWRKDLILTTDEVRLSNSKISSGWAKLKNMGATTRSWGDCFGYFLVCQGRADVMIDVDLKPYDILPLVPILRGAGVAIIDLSEKQDFSSIIACKPEIKLEIIERFEI